MCRGGGDFGPVAAGHADNGFKHVLSVWHAWAGGFTCCHRWCALFFALTVIVELYMLMRMEVLKDMER